MQKELFLASSSSTAHACKHRHLIEELLLLNATKKDTIPQEYCTLYKNKEGSDTNDVVDLCSA